MAINFCTLGGYTVNTFCNAIRQKVLDRLIEEAHPTQPPVPQPPAIGGGGSAFNPFNTFDFNNLPFITVTAELLGVTGTVVQDKNNRWILVTVSNLEGIDDNGRGAVNTTDSNLLQ